MSSPSSGFNALPECSQNRSGPVFSKTRLRSLCLLVVACSAPGICLAQSGDVPNTQPVAVEYPELGNTPETDRLLLREIGDSYIYDPTVTTRQQSELDAQMETVIAPLAVFEPTEKEPQTWSTWDSIRQSRG